MSAAYAVKVPLDRGGTYCSGPDETLLVYDSSASTVSVLDLEAYCFRHEWTLEGRVDAFDYLEETGRLLVEVDGWIGALDPQTGREAASWPLEGDWTWLETLRGRYLLAGLLQDGPDASAYSLLDVKQGRWLWRIDRAPAPDRQTTFEYLNGCVYFHTPHTPDCHVVEMSENGVERLHVDAPDIGEHCALFEITTLMGGIFLVSTGADDCGPVTRFYPVDMTSGLGEPVACEGRVVDFESTGDQLLAAVERRRDEVRVINWSLPTDRTTRGYASRTRAIAHDGMYGFHEGEEYIAVTPARPGEVSGWAHTWSPGKATDVDRKTGISGRYAWQVGRKRSEGAHPLLIFDLSTFEMPSGDTCGTQELELHRLPGVQRSTDEAGTVTVADDDELVVEHPEYGMCLVPLDDDDGSFEEGDAVAIEAVDRTDFGHVRATSWRRVETVERELEHTYASPDLSIDEGRPDFHHPVAPRLDVVWEQIGGEIPALKTLAELVDRDRQFRECLQDIGFELDPEVAFETFRDSCTLVESYYEETFERPYDPERHGLIPFAVDLDRIHVKCLYVGDTTDPNEIPVYDLQRTSGFKGLHREGGNVRAFLEGYVFEETLEAIYPETAVWLGEAFEEALERS